MSKSTWLATPNIAVVKYWGKRDSALNLPFNGSVSVTMDETVSTRTTVEFDSALPRDIFPQRLNVIGVNPHFLTPARHQDIKLLCVRCARRDQPRLRSVLETFTTQFPIPILPLLGICVPARIPIRVRLSGSAQIVSIPALSPAMSKPFPASGRPHQR